MALPVFLAYSLSYSKLFRCLSGMNVDVHFSLFDALCFICFLFRILLLKSKFILGKKKENNIIVNVKMRD